MHNQSYVFAQLASHLNRSKFNRIVAKYQVDSYIKVFSCWNQLKVLMFGQLSRRESLRDLMVAVKAHSGKAKFLGFGDSVTLSNLAKAWYIAECLKEARKQAGMTQQELADKIGKKRTYVSLIERGETDMQLSTFIQMSEALGLRFSLVRG